MIVVTNGPSPFGRLVVRLASGTGELIWSAGDGRGASPEVAGELDSVYDDTSRGEWPVATQTLEELLGQDRVPLMDALEAAHREGRGQPAGS